MKSPCPKSADKPSESHSQSAPHSLALLLRTTLYLESLTSCNNGDADVSLCMGEQFESLSLNAVLIPGVKVHKALLLGADWMILRKWRRSGLELKLVIAGVDSLEKWSDPIDLEDFICIEEFSWLHLKSILSLITSKLSFSLEISSSMVSKCEAVRPPRPSWWKEKNVLIVIFAYFLDSEYAKTFSNTTYVRKMSMY